MTSRGSWTPVQHAGRLSGGAGRRALALAAAWAVSIGDGIPNKAAVCVNRGGDKRALSIRIVCRLLQSVRPQSTRRRRQGRPGQSSWSERLYLTPRAEGAQYALSARGELSVLFYCQDTATRLLGSCLTRDFPVSCTEGPRPSTSPGRASLRSCSSYTKRCEYSRPHRS